VRRIASLRRALSSGHDRCKRDYTAMTGRLRASVVLIWTYAPAVVWACPECPIGKTAREQVLAHDFAQNLLIALAPFLLIAATCVWAEGIGKRGYRAER
jgi:hypothetical protein